MKTIKVKKRWETPFSHVMSGDVAQFVHYRAIFSFSFTKMCLKHNCNNQLIRAES